MAKFSKNFLPIFFLFVLTIIIFIPAMGIKFSWVDDGWDIQMCQQFINYAKDLNFTNFFGLFLETANGRFRPVYWIGQTAIFLIGEKNPSFHYALHFLLIFVTSLLIYEIVFFLTKSKWASLFSGIIFLLNPFNAENWYRLGPQEPFLGLFLITSAFFLLRGKKWSAIFFLLAAFFSKETAFAALPAIIIWYFLKRFLLKERDVSLEHYFLFGLFFFGVMLLVTSSIRTGYSQYYNFTISEMTPRFLDYIKISTAGVGPFLPLFAFTFLGRLIYSFLKRTSYWNFLFTELFFGIWFVGFLAVQSPWPFVIGRYLLPASIGLLIFMGMEFNQWEIFLRGKKELYFKVIVFIFASFYLLFISNNLFYVINYGRGTVHKTTHVQKMIKYLAENVPQNGKIFLNFAKGEGTIELVYETGVHLNLFYNRPDIKVDYFDIDELPQKPYFIVSGTSAPLGYSEQLIEKQSMVKLLTEIKSYGEIPVVTTSTGLLKQILKKSMRFVLYKEKFDLGGIYTPSYLRDYWKIYYAES